MSRPPQPITAVTVYCSSSTELHRDHLAVARRTGELIARSGRTLIYGGGKIGLMGEMARAAREGGGYVVGIITERLKHAEQLDPDNHENVVVASMRQRKALLEARADAMIVLPGGLGTLEEFFEILVGRLLGEHHKPILVVNPPDPEAGGAYYDPLLSMFDHMVRNRFARAGVRELFEVLPSPEEVVQRLDALSVPAEPADFARFMPSADAQATR